MALVKLTGELYQLYNEQAYSKCHSILPLLKVELIKNNLLVPLASNTSIPDQVNDIQIAQRILEIGTLSALLCHDHASFENNYAQLSPFYSNETLHPLPELNSEVTKVISLYLLYLLSQGLVSKFHVELEALFHSSQYDIDNDKYLSFPISLERYLMEGNYIKVWHLLKLDLELPCQEFSHFIPTLINALRYEIAQSLEKTYTQIPLCNCKSLLYFPQELLVAQFEKKLIDELDVSNWTVEDGIVHFSKPGQDYELDAPATIVNVLTYAEQLESII